MEITRYDRGKFSYSTGTWSLKNLFFNFIKVAPKFLGGTSDPSAHYEGKGEVRYLKLGKRS